MVDLLQLQKMFIERHLHEGDTAADFTMGNGHDKALRHFVDIVLNDAKKDFVPEQGVNMIKILTAIYESARTGREVLL